MRIITGRAKGLKLKTPTGMNTRPTADRIKESLFNILTGIITFENKIILDLFSGTGALGLEAISRGASKCTFVDLKTSNLIKENSIKAHFEDESEIIAGEAFKVLNQLNKEAKQYDLIFCDPPYHLGLWQRALIEIDRLEVLSGAGLIVVEHGADEQIETSFMSLELMRQVSYGRTTAIEIFKRKVE